MGLKIFTHIGESLFYEEDLLFTPAFTCDACGEVIEDLGTANYFWEKGTFQPGELLGPVYFAHRACNRAFEAKYGKLMFASLRDFTRYVNLKWNKQAPMPARQ